MRTILRAFYGIVGIFAALAGIYFIFQTIKTNHTDTVISDKAGIEVEEAPNMSSHAFTDSIKKSAKITWDGFVDGCKKVGGDFKTVGVGIAADTKEIVDDSTENMKKIGKGDKKK